MAKIHTRTKRKFNLSSSFGHKAYYSGKVKAHGPKTFKTEEQAKTYAESKGLKPEEYVFVKTKKGKKIKIELV